MNVHYSAAPNFQKQARAQHVRRRTVAQHFREPMIKKILARVSLVVVVVVPIGASAQQREIRLGHLHVIPSLSLQELYDDNIYYGNGSNRTTELKEADWITHTKPSLLLDYTLDGRGGIKLGYEGDFAKYAKNSINDWRTNHGLFDVDYYAPGGLIVKIKDVFADAEDPYGAPNEFGLGRKTKRWTEDCAAAVGFKFSDRFKVFMFYNFLKQRYDSKLDFTQNYSTGEIGAGCETKVADKTWLFLRYYAGHQSYDTHRTGVTGSNDASYGWKKVNTGLAWDPDARFQGQLNIGYQWNSFDNSHDQNNQSYKAKSSWIADTSVSYLQTATRTFTVALSRNFQLLGAGASGYSTNTALSIGMRQKIMSRYLLAVGYGYAINKYSSTEKRKDPIHTPMISFNYLLSDWLAADIGYSRIKNNSTSSSERYTGNRFSITLNVNPGFLHNDSTYWQ